jgi:hypothetical protein
LQAAGAVALLALENAQLDTPWKESVSELADSRARLVSVGARFAPHQLRHAHAVEMDGTQP